MYPFFIVSLPCIAPGNGLRQIWDLVMPSNSVLRNKGLVAIGLQNSVLIWVNRKPPTLGNITGWLTAGRKRDRQKEGQIEKEEGEVEKGADRERDRQKK